MKVLVIGAGNGGAATTVELAIAGHEVTLFARTEGTIAPFRESGIGYQGVLGEGRIAPRHITTDLADAIDGVEAAVIALPTFAQAGVARTLQAAGWGGECPVILNPGHTGGAFEVQTAFERAGGPVPPIAEFSTLAYVARKPLADTVNITGRAKALRAAALPGGERAITLACDLFPGAYDTGDVIAADLANINAVIHPPGAMLGAAWAEATGGDFTFYVQGMTPGVIEVMRALDGERMAIARAFGHHLPSIIAEMRAVGTVPADAGDNDYAAIASGGANSKIKAPDSLTHRYYTEDFAHGLVPLMVYAEIAGVAAPTASALIALHASMTRHLPQPAVRDASAMNLVGATIDSLKARAGI
ncbi:NAD/NADP octopine/nopaline dehydrogenase family protein [Pelagibacterium mangrovi]|uniref:NAD/NADP octopine/nopaline dehydrogenase family protein n=1 Tax=Pelagibacterium mangrovi TaxID=3119828 RepID=UPI002FC5D869